MIDILQPKKIAANMAIYITPQSETLNPDSSAETAALTADSVVWQNLARCKQAQFEPETEDDEEDSFDAVTKTRIKSPNTQVTGRKWTFDLERYTLLYEAMNQGVKDPFSTETQAAIEAGEPVAVYATNDPKLPVGMKLETYDANGTLLHTQYMYGDILSTQSQTFDGKIIRPQIVFDVAASAHNVKTFAPAFTGAAS